MQPQRLKGVWRMHCSRRWTITRLAYHPRMDQFSAIRVFIRTVDTGSLTRAASHLGIPKSTASKLLAELEAHLGVKLLNRSTRAIKLTDEGSAYYRQVSAIMLRLGEADAELRESGAGPRGRIRLDAPSSLANAILIPVLGEFRALYPDIELVVGIGDRPISLIEEAADCVIRFGSQTDASLIARVIYEDRLVTCASPRYLARKGMPAAPRDLADRHDLVGYFSALTGQAAPLVFRRGDEMHQLDGFGMLSNDSAGHLTMILSSLGIGQVYRSTIRAHLAAGLLVPLLGDWETGTAPVSILYPPSRRSNKRVRLFIDWLGERLVREAGA